MPIVIPDDLNGQLVPENEYFGTPYSVDTDTALNSRPRGSKPGYVDPLSLVPSEGRFNPYDYLNLDYYRLNRRGQRLQEHDLLMLQYLADQRQQEWELDYESPVQDVARQRAAGLNPDLLGLSGADAGQGPASLGNGISPVKTNMDLGIDVFSLIAGTLTNLASLGMTAAGLGPNIQGAKLRNDLTAQSIENAGITHDILQQQLSGQQLSNEGKELKNVADAYKLGSDLGSMTNFIYDKSGNIDWSATASQSITKFPKVSRALRDKYGSFLESASKYGRGLHNALTTAYDIENDRYDQAKLQADPYWSPLMSEMVDAFRPLLRAQANLMKRQLNFQGDYYNRLNVGVDGKSGGMIAAESEMFGNLSSGSTNRMMYNLSKPLKEVINTLSVKAEQGKIWASMALSSLWIGSMAAGGASYSRTSGPDGIETSFGWN